MDIQEFVRDDGSIPFQKWFKDLDAQAAVKITVAINRLKLGNTSNIKWFGGIGEDKINWGAGYRIYLVQDGKELIVLFGGGTKKTQQSDIAKAQALYEEYKFRKKSKNSQSR